MTTNYLFLTTNTHEIITPISNTYSNNNLDTLIGTVGSSTEPITFARNEYVCLDNYIEVPGVGVIRDGDKVKLCMFDKTYYTLHFGWYTTNDGLDLYGWYLVNNETVRSFYRRYIGTLEIVEFCGKC